MGIAVNKTEQCRKKETNKDHLDPFGITIRYDKYQFMAIPFMY
jgi:hypothetical protein